MIEDQVLLKRRHMASHSRRPESFTPAI